MFDKISKKNLKFILFFKYFFQFIIAPLIIALLFNILFFIVLGILHGFTDAIQTYITRAKECGCNPELVMKWVGHEFDADVKTSRVDRGYTTYSQEYILQEINKIDYEL